MPPLHLYVDGSCGDNRNVGSETIAGWGVCIVRGDSGTGRGQGEVVQEISGRVMTNPESADYLGATVGSNNTAELTAIGHALRWALIEGGMTHSQSDQTRYMPLILQTEIGNQRQTKS